MQNDPLVIDSLIPEIAHEMYPAAVQDRQALSTPKPTDFIQFENERVEEMIDIVREETGKEYDPVHHRRSRPICRLAAESDPEPGRIGQKPEEHRQRQGWIIGTAQQTLTEDDPRAALNSPELYKLKDRFPIQIDLESSDIKEICYRRLLGKSAQGETDARGLFDQHGQALRHNTRLQDAKYYDADFDKTTFVNLYPFLPAHFDILLHLLGALAKSTGGIGLRSAIKVIQDILIEGPEGHDPVANQTRRLAGDHRHPVRRPGKRYSPGIPFDP